MTWTQGKHGGEDWTNLQTSRPCSLVATRRAFVLLNVLGPGWSYLHALAMEPLFAYVATNPELIRSIVFSTCPTQCIPMLFLIIFFQSIIIPWLPLWIFARFRSTLFSCYKISISFRHDDEWFSHQGPVWHWVSRGEMLSEKKKKKSCWKKSLQKDVKNICKKCFSFTNNSNNNAKPTIKITEHHIWKQ